MDANERIPIGANLRELLTRIKRAGKKAVFLIDEYDSPMHGATRAHLDVLDNFFTPLKDNDLLKKLIVFETHKKLHLVGTSTNDTVGIIEASPFYNMFGWTEQHLREIFSERDPSYDAFKPPNFEATVTVSQNASEYSRQ